MASMVQASFQLIPDCYTESSGKKRYPFDRSDFSSFGSPNSFVLPRRYPPLINVLLKGNDSSLSFPLFFEARTFSRIDPPNSRILFQKNRGINAFFQSIEARITRRKEASSTNDPETCSCNTNRSTIRNSPRLVRRAFTSSLSVSRTFCRRCLELPKSLPSLISRTRAPLVNLDPIPLRVGIRFQIDSIRSL